MIHIIRHGKTVANEKKLYCGQTNLPLSEQGILDILEYKKRELYPGVVDVFFTSGMLRAEETMQLIYGQVASEVLPQLAEFNFGSFEMKSYDNLKRQPGYQDWINDEVGDVRCPGGECKLGFTQRVLEGFDALLCIYRQQEAGSALLLSHGGVIVCLMEHLFPKTRNFYEWQPGPGRGYTLSYSEGGKWQWKDL